MNGENPKQLHYFSRLVRVGLWEVSGGDDDKRLSVMKLLAPSDLGFQESQSVKVLQIPNAISLRFLLVRPILTGVSTSNGCNEWLSPAYPTLKVAHAGRNRSLVARTGKCGWASSVRRRLGSEGYQL